MAADPGRGPSAGTAADLTGSARAVLFDFYGTLARAVSYGLTYEEVFERWGVPFDSSTWAAWTNRVHDGQEHLEHSASRDTYVAWELERLRSVVASLPVPGDHVDAMVADLHAASKDFTLAAYDEVADVLAGLRSGGVTVAVCSNWDWDLDRALDRSGLTGAADVVVTSAQAGARKPHRRIFAVTLDRCGVTPDQAVFVGDSWGPDVEGPRAMGMAAVHLCRPDRPGPAPPLPPGVRRISDLREL